MTTLEIQNIPDDLYDELAKTAKLENRTIAQETIVLLRTFLETNQEHLKKRKAVVDEIDKLRFSLDISAPNPEDLLRLDRDRLLSQ